MKKGIAKTINFAISKGFCAPHQHGMKGEPGPPGPIVSDLYNNTNIYLLNTIRINQSALTLTFGGVQISYTASENVLFYFNKSFFVAY